MMNVYIAKTLKRAASKLHKNQKEELEQAFKAVKKDVNIGDLKIGDLSGVRVYKFHSQNQLVLLAYIYDETSETLTFLAFGTHENFYRDLKRQFFND